MEITTKKSMHPLIAMAAVSVTLFSLVGIGAITGLIPTSRGQSAQVLQAKAEEQPAKPVAAAETATTTASETKAAAKPAAHKVAVRHVKHVERLAKRAEEPARTVKEPAPVTLAQYTPPATMAPPPPNQPAPSMAPVKPLCHDCGVIESVREVEKKGEAIGSGTAIGGIAGGILGNQAGRGNGRTAMTLLGAIGGAIAGHEIEKNTNKVKAYEIDIRFDDGSTQLITQNTPPVWRSGDRVKLVNGVITARNG